MRPGGVARRVTGGLAGRYLLSLAARPFLGTLAIVLPALLLERLLRLFDLVASDNVPALAVVRMLVDLLPHYMGLALPAALFVGIYVVIAGLSAGNELDALQNAGLSLLRISRPFLCLGALAALLGLGLYGTLQPLSRYAYRAAFEAATQGSWDATMVPGELVRVSPRLLVTADKVDRSGSRLRGVLIHQSLPDGAERITTARQGTVALSADGTRLLLTLRDAIQLDTRAGRQPGSLETPAVTMDRPFSLVLARFRARGADEREMTSSELRRAEAHPTSALPRRRLQAEWHGRLARALALALMPVLAVPLGLSAKRAKRQYGLVAGVLILVLFFHALQLAQSLGSAGVIDARPEIWAVMLLFALLCGAAFARASRHPGENPLDPLLALSQRLLPAVTGWLPSGLLRGRRSRRHGAGLGAAP